MEGLTIKRFRFSDSKLMSQAFDIRTVVFIREQAVPVELEKDEHDRQATHYLLFIEGEPIAAARHRKTTDGIKLERFAVLKEFRNKGIGGKILQFVLDELKGSNEKIYLNSQEPAVNFYKRHGFSVEGEMFWEAGIRHYRMVYSW